MTLSSLALMIIKYHYLLIFSTKIFSLKDMGTLHYILGIEVFKLRHGSLLLHQSKYTGALLPKTYFIDAKLMVSPIVYFVKLFDSDGFPINSI